jgi:hypothetical protein
MLTATNFANMPRRTGLYFHLRRLNMYSWQCWMYCLESCSIGRTFKRRKIRISIYDCSHKCRKYGNIDRTNTIRILKKVHCPIWNWFQFYQSLHDVKEKSLSALFFSQLHSELPINEQSGRWQPWKGSHMGNTDNLQSSPYIMTTYPSRCAVPLKGGKGALPRPFRMYCKLYIAYPCVLVPRVCPGWGEGGGGSAIFYF